MRKDLRTLYILPVLLMVLMAACSAPEDSDPTNNNSAASVPQNEPQVTNVSTPPVTPEPQPTAKLPTSRVPEQMTTNGTTPAAQPATGNVPKLVVPKTTIDFGKQAKEKSLARTFTIKNGGTAELKIDAVEPS